MPSNRDRNRERERAIDPRPLLLAWIVLTALALSALLTAPPSAHALVLKRSVERMSEDASAVVLADVASVRVAVSGSGNRAVPYSVVRFRPVETLKGAGRREFEVRLPGGRVGDRLLYVSDQPVFVSGQRALVFLDGTDRVLAGRQGALTVARERVVELRQSYAHVRERVGRADKLGAAGAAVLEGLGVGMAEVGIAGGPVITDVSPAAQSAGTNTTVTITGSGFGAAQGTVNFYYDDAHGDGPIPADEILSWSDTEIVTEVPAYYFHAYPASAGSGPMTVVDATGAASAPWDAFSVTFSYGGGAWADPTVPYFRCPSLSAVPGGASAVDSAAATWQAPSAFMLAYAGQSGEPPNGTDGKNQVAADILPPGYLGLAYIWFGGPGLGTIDECDYFINIGDSSIDWGDGSGGTYDVQSVAVHEFGHWVGLNDLYGPRDSSKVLYGYGSRGEFKRDLHWDDGAGALWTYGPGAPDTTAPVSANNAAGPYTGSATIRITATDVGRGVATISYRLDGDTTRTALGASVYAGAGVGEHSLVHWATDWVGNQEVAHGSTFTVNPAPPAPPPVYTPEPAPAPVLPTAALSRPYARSYTAYLNRAVTAHGYLKPRHATGAYSVKLIAYHYEGDKWVRRATFSAKNYAYNSSTTKYQRAFAFNRRGRWRVRAYHADAGHAPSYSSYSYFTVR